MKLAKRVECVPLAVVYPPHGIDLRDEDSVARVEAILETMQDQGWLGRPLVTFRLDDRLKALTGSHRFVAASKASVQEIPVIVLNPVETRVAKSGKAWLLKGDPPITHARVSRELIEAGFVALGELISLDTEFMPYDQTWDAHTIRGLENSGYNPELVDLMRVRKWCGRTE